METEYRENGVAKRSILIVEDNEINREMLKSILQNEYHILEAVDGREGMELLRANYQELSLVLLDVQMPRMNGYEFLEAYTADPMLAVVPIIVTTGSTISEDEEKCLAMGASDFVTKPYNPRIILRRIQAVIRLNESIATLRAVEYDALTGMYTKNAFWHHAANRLRFVKSGGYDMLMINVERFAYINERYGESMGDDLLRHIGKSISFFRGKETIACRYHADRFVLMRPHRAADHDAEIQWIDRIIHDSAPLEDFIIKYAIYERVDPNASMGVLCDRLSLALRTISRQYGHNLACYDKALAEQIDRRRRIESCMQEALQEGQFKVYYQPKHEAATGKIAGAEALVRWVHPEYGFLSPAEFIPLFEENGFITQLDLYVWNTVCNDLKRWQSQGIGLVPVSVNASRRDFLSLDQVDSLLEPIRQCQLDRRYLHVEITESLGIDDQSVYQKVKAIRDRGIKIELDDFGSGHSSLSTIRDIPMDVIKLDVSFIRSLDTQKEIVKMIIMMAHALGHKTVAEGIETWEQHTVLQGFGCDYIQGYYYSRPIPEEEFAAYLRNNEHAEQEDLCG